MVSRVPRSLRKHQYSTFRMRVLNVNVTVETREVVTDEAVAYLFGDRV